MNRVVAICNRKGGCGKSTTAVNLAAALAHHGRSVLIIDADSQAHSTLSLGGSAGDADLSTVLLEPGAFSRAIRGSYLPNLKMVPGSKKTHLYERKFGNRKDLLRRLDSGLNSLNGRFDYVIIDTPPILGHITYASLIAADEVIVPTQMHYLSMEGLAELLSAVGKVGKVRGRELRVTGVVPTFFNERMRLSRTIIKEITDQLGDNSILGPVRTNVALAEAPAYGQTVFQYDRRSNGAADYLKVAAQLEERNG